MLPVVDLLCIACWTYCAWIVFDLLCLVCFKECYVYSYMSKLLPIYLFLTLFCYSNRSSRIMAPSPQEWLEIVPSRSVPDQEFHAEDQANSEFREDLESDSQTEIEMEESILRPMERFIETLPKRTSLECLLWLNFLLFPINELCECHLDKIMCDVECNDIIEFLTSVEKILVHLRDQPKHKRDDWLSEKQIQRADDELFFLNRLDKCLLKYFQSFISEHYDCEDFTCIANIDDKENDVKELVCLLQIKNCEQYYLPNAAGRSKNLEIRQQKCRLVEYVRRNNRRPAIDLKGSILEKQFPDELTTRSLQTSSKEAACSVCFDELRDSTDFSIIDCCSHLLCCSCAERMYFVKDDDKRYANIVELFFSNFFIHS